MISDPFKSVWRDYRNIHDIETRRSYLKQLQAAAYYQTLFTGNIKQRGCVVAIGNRIRKSTFANVDRDTVYKLWAIANQPKPKRYKNASKTPIEVSKRETKTDRQRAVLVEVKKKKVLLR